MVFARFFSEWFSGRLRRWYSVGFREVFGVVFAGRRRAGLVGHASRLGSGWAPCGEAAGGGSAKNIRGFCSAGFSSTMSLLPSQLRLVMLGQG